MTVPSNDAARWVVPIALTVLWIASLALPAVSVAGGPGLDGLDLLRRGWQGATVGVYAWYANPLFAAAVVGALARRYLSAGVASGAGLVLALTSFAAAGLARNAGASAPELSFEIGFYLWLTAQLGLFGWCWASIYREIHTANQ